MAIQSFKKHLKFYPAHHFVFYPTSILLFGYTVYLAVSEAEKMVWIILSIVVVMIAWLSYMMRQHYALMLQDRIIRLELRYRYFALTGKRLEILEGKLRDRQLFALRFCSDEELPLMVRKAVDENLSGHKIKKLIRNWKADENRV
jgi:ABC-type siderophore export system fused ATPase/permease subunit